MPNRQTRDDTDGVDSDPKGRGNTVAIERAWLDFLHSLWTEVKTGTHPLNEGTPLSLEAFGKVLALRVGRAEPWSKASLSRFMAGKQVTDDLVEAFSIYFGIPYPTLTARHPDEVRWFIVGRALREASPAQFAKLLTNAQNRARLARESRELDQELDETPDD